MSEPVPTPETFRFADDGIVPNNPRLPLLLYRGALALTGAGDPAAVVEVRFAGNGWGDMWRDGVYAFVHYHSQIHEAMGVARGRAWLRLGGDHGVEVEVAAGDAAVLPAGTGHQCLWASADFQVVGAYPGSGTYDLCRGGAEEHARALQTIPRVPLPKTDPLGGRDGPLLRLWS